MAAKGLGALSEYSRYLKREIKKQEKHEKRILVGYASKMGRVLIEWNGLHSTLFLIFWSIIGDAGHQPRALATNLWNTVSSDDMQRKMLSSVIEDRYHKDKKYLEKARWLLKKVGEFAQYRNIAAHMPMRIEWDGNKPLTTTSIDGTKENSVMKHLILSEKFPDFWNKMALDLRKLDTYAQTLWLSRGKQAVALPHKPRLPSLRAVAYANDLVSQALDSPRPKRRKRASASRRKRGS